MEIYKNSLPAQLDALDSAARVQPKSSIERAENDKRISQLVVNILDSLPKSETHIEDKILLLEHIFVAIDHIQSKEIQGDLKNLVLLKLNMLPPGDKIAIQLKDVMKNVANAQSIKDIQNIYSDLEKAAPFIKSEEAHPEVKAQFLSVCDKLSTRLLNKSLVQGTPEHPRPLDKEINWKSRVQMAASIRSLASNCSVGADALKMSKFNSSDVPQLAMVGNKMDPGVHYQNVDSQAVVGNQVSLSRRILLNADKTPSETRTQMRLQLSPKAREEMNSNLLALMGDKQEFARALEAHFGTKVTISEKTVNYEISDSPGDHKGISSFIESKATFGTFISIELEGIGQVLIGREDMAVGDKAQAEESTKGRYTAHHTILVRLKDGLVEENKLNASTQFNKMHQLLSAVGLSSVLTNSSPEEKNKAQVMHIIGEYLPHLAVQLGNNSAFLEMNPQKMRDYCVYLLPKESADGAITQSEMRDIFEEELKAGVKSEKTILGNEVSKLSKVADKIRSEGALGFFAGINSNPAVVASVLKTGCMSSDVRNSIGFKFPSTCQEDAITAGNEAVFLRLATEGGVEQMNKGAVKLSDCPYIQTYQMVVSLDVANMPNNKMHGNSYGIGNPLAEIVMRDSKGQVTSRVSGTKILKAENPIQYTRAQNQKFTVDNEVMLRIGALSPQHIEKITYQDPRKALLQFLVDKEAPEALTSEITSLISKGAKLDSVKKDIELFLKDKGLLEEKDNWNKTAKVLNIVGMKSDFNFGSDLQNYLINPKQALIDELNKLGLIDKDGRIYGKPIESFIVEANTLSKELF
jgi:hypothetical protein